MKKNNTTTTAPEGKQDKGNGHTPGQWETDATTLGSISLWANDERSEGTLIASIYYEAKEAEANAALIAAAPDLLEALKALVHGNNVGMGKKAMALRFELAEDIIKKSGGNV